MVATAASTKAAAVESATTAATAVTATTTAVLGECWIWR
jgi:hypothetical protein